ncbi:MAG: hypothetical protein Harvfovirus6_13 [Harvfovirus sp.]|uniref:Uncharacterized protein n=1 Tax=Harvfovirus sp. TaxID=2487768 RepID=A0A3G5A4L3_9VIRU|nr:MAG: hypothetical protein Harvfovirus6_13 [Harvfovirus sp.]
MRRLVYFARQIKRFPFSGIPRRSKSSTRVICALALPVALIPFRQNTSAKQKYHIAATDFIQYTSWENILENCPEEKFREILGYIAYCQRNVPELIPTWNSNQLIYKIRDKDRDEATITAKLNGSTKIIKPKWLSILNETIGLDNLNTNIYESYLIFRGLPNNPETLELCDYFFDNIKKPANRLKLLEELLKEPPNELTFKYIQKYNTSDKIIFRDYSKYAYNSRNFKYFADKGLIDPTAVIDYMQVALNNSEFTAENRRQILKYLLALNPDPSVKPAMKFMLLDAMREKIERERKFISSLIKTIDYEFTDEEKKKFRDDLNSGYKRLRYYESKVEAKGFTEYIRSNHPELGSIYLDEGIRKRKHYYDDD